MKKFVITSDHFAGQIDAWYGANGNLCYLNMLQAEGSDKVLTVTLNMIPYQLYRMEFLNSPRSLSFLKIQEVPA